MIEIGALWKSVTKSGKGMMKGSLNGASLIILPNDRKTKDNHPDYRVFIAEAKKKDGGGSQKHEEDSDALPF